MESGDLTNKYGDLMGFNGICIYIYILVGGLEPCNFMTFHTLGMSSSQLTNMFQRGRYTTIQFLYIMIFLCVSLQFVTMRSCFLSTSLRRAQSRP